MLSTNEKQAVIHRLLSDYRYYKVHTLGHWAGLTDGARKYILSTGLVTQYAFEFYIRRPSSQIIYEANLVYDNAMKYTRFNDTWNDMTITEMLKKHEVHCPETYAAWEDDDKDPVYYWSDEMEENMEKVGKSIEEIKVKLYKNADAIKSKVEEIRRDLRRTQAMYDDLFHRKHAFDSRTAEHIATQAYSRYLYDNTVYTKDKVQVKGLPFAILDSIAYTVARESVPLSHIREISHTSPWLSYYNTAKNRVFTVEQFTSEALSLISFSRWYEWIRGLGDETPSDEVINDDDMIDGWYILKEREKPVKRDKLVEASDRNVESFVMAKSQSEAQEIYRKNNKAAAGIMFNRSKQMAQGAIPDHKLHDVAFDLAVRANNMGINRVMSGTATKR